jgi:hypothetical protein
MSGRGKLLHRSIGEDLISGYESNDYIVTVDGNPFVGCISASERDGWAFGYCYCIPHIRPPLPFGKEKRVLYMALSDDGGPIPFIRRGEVKITQSYHGENQPAYKLRVYTT